MSPELKKELSRISDLKAQLAFQRTSLKKEEKALAEAQARRDTVLQAQEVLQKLAQAVQQEAHHRISEVVSSCLATVFDNPYQFKIEFDRKRGRTEARLRFVRDGLEVDPLTASGGGMVDVAAFALRVACLVLHRPRLNRVLVIDEGFKFVSAQYRPNVRLMLEGLAKDLNVQIVHVTHIEEFETGTVIQL